MVVDNLPEEEDATAQEEKAASHRVQLVDHVDDPLGGQGLGLGRLVEEGGGQKVHDPRHLDVKGRLRRTGTRGGMQTVLRADSQSIQDNTRFDEF